MRIGDLVTMDLYGDFRSDVQLSDFDDPKLNLELLRHYIFSVHAPSTYGAQQRTYSARDVLDQLKTIYTVERAENRIVLTANYGHGKSHLALVLANFFSRPVDSPEMKIIFDRLAQALNNPSQLAGYRDFKASKGEFLVIRLQGDAFSDLQEGFVRALEKALREHSSTRSLEIPFWYRKAQSWLNALTGDARKKAESFLADHNTDLSVLSVSLSRQGNYELVRELARYITGVYPDFGREVSLEEMVLWTVDEVCKLNGLAGLLVLFDEFGLFLQKYMAARSVGKLQELLNGISKRPGKSAFLAFSQQDVDTLAETYAQGQRREDVKKELERLPKDKRARLHSLMEGVLASYLKQDGEQWAVCFADSARKGHLVQAGRATEEHFRKRYAEYIKWDHKAFEEKVVMGCFPLHPMTTAILSEHSFEAGAAENPRTALQFVRQVWQEWQQKLVFCPDGRPNFVYPVAMVDFFREQISKKWYAAYRHAVEAAPQRLSEEQQRVLQALLLQQAVGLKAAGDDQIDLLYHLSGVSRENIKKGLKDLSAQRVIRHDPVHKVFSLLPESVRPQEVEEVIQKAVEKTPIDRSLMDKIIGQLPQIEVSSLEFGHVSDWTPKQVALTADMFTVKELKALCQPFRRGAYGIEEGARGVVVWLIAQTEAEKIHLRQTAQAVLDEALGSTERPLPIVIVLPKRVTASLIPFARRLSALENLNSAEREKIGTVIYQQEKVLVETSFKSARDELFGDTVHYLDTPRTQSEYALPRAYQPSVQALRNLSLKAVVTECYRQAYAYRPKFYTQYQLSAKGPNKLRDAVRSVALWLFSDTAGRSISNLGSKDLQYQLSTRYLTTEWGLLAVEDSYAIRPPRWPGLREAWELLEQTFAPGCSDVRMEDVVIRLLNPPYGHDYNTLTLLLAAWIGFHRHELCLSLNGRLVTIEELKRRFDETAKPQDFLNQICVTSPLTISRIKSSEVFAQVDSIMEQIRRDEAFTVAQAREALTVLAQAMENPRLPETKRDEIHRLRSRLEGAFLSAQEYDRQVSTWIDKLETADMEQLLKAHDTLKNLSRPTLVIPEQPSLHELEGRWEAAVVTALPNVCAQYSHLRNLEEYPRNEEALKRLRKALELFPSFAGQVDHALEVLSQRRDELKKRDSEKVIVAEINRMTSSAALSVLYEYRDRLEAMTDLSLETTRLRDRKLSEIATRIRQYEQLVEELPLSIGRLRQWSDLRQHRDTVLRNLDQFKDTRFYEILIDAKNRLDHLENFLEQLRQVDSLPRNTPRNVDDVEAQLTNLESHFSSWLGPAQLELLEKRRQDIAALRKQKIAEATKWLEEIEQGARNDQNPESLLRKIEAPPPFLPTHYLARLEETKRVLHQRLNEDLVLQIESLFRKLSDPEIRRECLNRLQEIVEAG